ncbi:UNVERIFIED_CONTAM: hypothetical protein PYX00_002138 [Menopon gallinae]|uniref:G-protein coupled receptors family 1 profile domain-containing protein n=1 Tax=Menopon gallinae TaxID=328185 RepID=A0AAW2IGR3_9NEOP
MNLSVSDLMFCCFNLPLAASTFYSRSWRHGKLLCQLFPLLRYGLLAVSLFTVLAITINRYIMIGHPTLYPMMYKKEYLGLMVACTWVCGFGALVATWLGAWGQFGLDRQIGSCSILPDEKGRSPKTFLFMVAFVIPCIAIVVCYARIFYIVRRTALKSHSGARSAKSSRCRANNSSGRRGSPGGAASAGKMTSKDKKLLKMILVIFLSFLICYLPITISKTFRHVLEIHSLNIAGYVLIYLTTCINPIIYVVMSSEYRQAYKNLLTCKAAEMTQQNRSGSQK